MSLPASDTESPHTLWRLACCLIPSLTPALLRRMVEADCDVQTLFTPDAEALLYGIGVRTLPFQLLAEREQAMTTAREELKFCRQHHIDILTPWDGEYPHRLLETPDFPKVLFRLGHCDLNAPRIVSFVGTRRATAYGLDFTDRAVRELAAVAPGILVVSGLALGIDGRAHCTALETGLPTAAVVAHGLSRIYPAQHRDLAERIVRAGGCILSEYTSAEPPYRKRFLERNRIVAGLSDAVVVSESPVKGGAMSTANTAFSYDRTVLALPGRTSDEQSGGCNLLIARHQARIILSVADMLSQMGIADSRGATEAAPNLFPVLNGNCGRIYELLQVRKEPLTIDDIAFSLSLPVPAVMAEIAEMEFDALVARRPGNRFEAL